VLDAVVDAVGDGSLSWDDDVQVRDELDSYQSGITQDDRPGTLLTVRVMAERMIEISDNAATNHLMDGPADGGLDVSHRLPRRVDRDHHARVRVRLWLGLALVAKAWMNRFRFGPAEWVLRSITYGRRQPLRR